MADPKAVAQIDAWQNSQSNLILKGADLTGIDLSHRRLMGSIRNTIHCLGCDFSGANLSHAVLEGLMFSNCNFLAADFTGVEFLSTLEGRDSNLMFADLRGIRGPFGPGDVRGIFNENTKRLGGLYSYFALWDSPYEIQRQIEQIGLNPNSFQLFAGNSKVHWIMAVDEAERRQKMSGRTATALKAAIDALDDNQDIWMSDRDDELRIRLYTQLRNIVLDTIGK